MPSERAVGAVRIDPVEEEYRIGTQDLIEVQVLGIQDLRREARVNAKGMIGLPLIGAVRVAGLTAAEAEALIGGLYSKNYLQNPEVSVFVKEYTRQNVTIDGAVGKPGIYPLKGPTTLLQALANAGGQGSLTDLSDVVLFRMEENERRAIKFDVTKIRSGRSSGSDAATRRPDRRQSLAGARRHPGFAPRRHHRDLQPVQLRDEAVGSRDARRRPQLRSAGHASGSVRRPRSQLRRETGLSTLLFPPEVADGDRGRRGPLSRPLARRRQAEVVDHRVLPDRGRGDGDRHADADADLSRRDHAAGSTRTRRRSSRSRMACSSTPAIRITSRRSSSC